MARVVREGCRCADAALLDELRGYDEEAHMRVTDSRLRALSVARAGECAALDGVAGLADRGAGRPRDGGAHEAEERMREILGDEDA